MTSVVASIFGGHNSDIVNQDLELFMVEILYQLVIVGFELLKTIVIVEKFVN